MNHFRICNVGNIAQLWSKAVLLHTCYVTIVLLQLMSLNPLVATLLVDMNFMVIRTDGNFFKEKQRRSTGWKYRLTDTLDQFLPNSEMEFLL